MLPVGGGGGEIRYVTVLPEKTVGVFKSTKITLKFTRLTLS